MIVTAILARNEADRYLRRTLENAASLTDHTILLDDGSTDTTADLARELGATVLPNPAAVNGGWWGAAAEAPARSALWHAAVSIAGPTGWVYVADADHELLGITKADMRTLARSSYVNAWCWPLWDCWDSDEQHRVDGFWQGWRVPRPWMVRALPMPDFEPAWGRQDIHVGHLPANYPLRLGNAPGGIRHLGWVSATDRTVKARRYLDLPTRQG